MADYYGDDAQGGRDIEDPLLGMNELGTTIAEGQNVGGKDFLATLQAAIHEGASKVELSLGGGEMREGPDSYSNEKLQDLRDMAKHAEVDLVSIHTPVQKVSNLSGYAQQQDGGARFSEEHQQNQLNEVKKAINFAASTTEGSAVVVHTAEFPRPITQFDNFATYPGVENPEEKERIAVVNTDSQTVQNLPLSHELPLPKYKEVYENGKRYYLDNQGNKLDLSKAQSEEEREQMLLRRAYETDEDGTPIFNNKKIKDHLEDFRQKGIKEHPEVEFFREFQRNNLTQKYNQELYYATQAQQAESKLNRMNQEIEKLQKEPDSEEKRQKLAELEQQKPLFESEVNHAKSASAASHMELQKNLNDLKFFKPVSEYGKEVSAKGFAEAGLHAMKVSEENKDKLKRGIFVAPENIFPEMGYGSHPEELKELVQLSRKEMVNKLMKDGWDENKAWKEANEHIKATFDTEHAGMWKRYMERKPGETEAQFNERFNKWFEEQSRDLAEGDVVGHTHLADGFGYGHANLPPGQGNLPVKKAVEYLKEKGYKGAFLSEGYGDPSRQLRDAWAYFGSPIYSQYMPKEMKGRTWDDVWQSHPKYLSRPTYMFGNYVPSKEFSGEPFWSGVPLE